MISHNPHLRKNYIYQLYHSSAPIPKPFAIMVAVAGRNQASLQRQDLESRASINSIYHSSLQKHQAVRQVITRSTHSAQLDPHLHISPLTSSRKVHTPEKGTAPTDNKADDEDSQDDEQTRLILEKQKQSDAAAWFYMKEHVCQAYSSYMLLYILRDLRNST